MIPAKRILLVHWTRAPIGGGVESHLIDLANGLAARNHDVFLITGTKSDAFEFNDSVQLVYTPDLDLFRHKDLHVSTSINFADTLNQLVSSLHPDVVHGHNLDHFGGEPLRSLLVTKTKTPFVFVHTSHSVSSDGEGTALLPYVDVRLAVSHSLCRTLGSATGSRFSCLYLAVDSGRFRSSLSPLENEGINILLPARLVPEKGALVAVHALDAIRKAGIDASLVLASPAQTADRPRTRQAYEHAVRAAVKRLGISRHITFDGVSLFEMPQIYDSADIVILPSLFREPFGLAALEGMSCSRPVVMTARSGLAELVHDQKTGILLDNVGHEDLAAAVSTAVAARSSTRHIGRQARQLVESRFAIASYLDTVEKSYDESMWHQDA